MNASNFSHAISLYFSARKHMVGLTTMIRHYGGLITDEYGQNTKRDMTRAMGFDGEWEYIKAFNHVLNKETESYRLYTALSSDYDVDNVDRTLLLRGTPLVDNGFGKTLPEFFDDAISTDHGCMFLVQPTMEKALKTYSCHTYSHDELWFCSDWKEGY